MAGVVGTLEEEFLKGRKKQDKKKTKKKKISVTASRPQKCSNHEILSIERRKSNKEQKTQKHLNASA